MNVKCKKKNDEGETKEKRSNDHQFLSININITEHVKPKKREAFLLAFFREDVYSLYMSHAKCGQDYEQVTENIWWMKCERKCYKEIDLVKSYVATRHSKDNQLVMSILSIKNLFKYF